MPSAQRWMVLTAVIAAFLPVVIDVTILHITVPSLTLALGATSTEVLWIIDVYPLVMAGLLIPMGTLGDRIGLRRVMMIGLCVFGGASVLTAFATSAAMLIASRALLAVGGSMIMPAVLAIIRQTFENEQERAKALGVWTIVGAAGGAIAPLIGGVLLEHFWWGAVFLVNVPIMAIILPFAYRVLPPNAPRREVEWRIGPALVLLVGLLATVYAIKMGAKGDSPGWQFLIALALGITFLTCFGRLQASAVSPMLDLSLFKSPTLVAGLMMAFVASGAIAGFELVLAQELQFVAGLTPLDAGIFMTPLAVAAAVSGPVAGRLIGIVGLRVLSTANLLVASASLAFLAMIDLHGDGLLSAVLLAALGFSLGSVLLAASVAIMGGAPAERAGAAGALESTSFELGGALGITAFGVLVGAVYRSSLDLGEGMAAGTSIGEAVIAASRLGKTEGTALMAMAGRAFIAAHDVVLQGAALAVLALAIAVLLMLRSRAVRADTHEKLNQP